MSRKGKKGRMKGRGRVREGEGGEGEVKGMDSTVEEDRESRRRKFLVHNVGENTSR